MEKQQTGQSTSMAEDRKSPAVAAPSSPSDPQQQKDHEVSNTSADAAASAPDPPPTVRFSSAVEEIDPTEPVVSFKDSALGEVTSDEIKAIANSFHATPLQGRRMSNFAFEVLPLSLPASRVPSHDDHSAVPSRQPSQSTLGHSSPHLSPRGPADMHSPPLTPAGTDPSDTTAVAPAGKAANKADQPEKLGVTTDLDPRAITPQASSHEASPPRVGRPLRQRSSSSQENMSAAIAAAPVPASPSETDPTDPTPTSAHADDEDQSGGHRKGMFSIGPGGSSGPASRDVSPSRAAASAFYSRPMTPSGDANDPYAANRRPAQANATNHQLDSRFVFSLRRSKAPSSGSGGPSSSASAPRTSTESKTSGHDKRHAHAGFLGAINRSHGSHELHPNDSVSSQSRQGSMSDLKRFFKVGGGSKAKRATSPSSNRSGVRTPPSSKSSHQVPFGDDHGLASKYGKLGKVLGAGAGGSVRLMKRSDNTVFAVKEFRPRHSYETEKDYVKKLTAEFCIGSTLHHGNVIETLDIVQEKGKWFEVMEYAPYDLFAIVMTGKMSREEVRCCFLQILSGVTYLHSIGLAHRDLKLDNVVVGEHGIMKIIDFGSAHVFKYPFESTVNLASGIVGSDPYLAPEVYDQRKYDPQAVDIWSLAIIYCCMSLRRFPWKLPRLTDNSYKLFAAEPTPGHDPERLILPSSRSTGDLTETPQRDMFPGEAAGEGGSKSTSNVGNTTTEKKEVIRGPWRLLRLLPRYSRHVVGRMLQIDPKKRAKMTEILDEDWIANTVICRQSVGGHIELADDHAHVLEGPTAAAK